MNIISKPTIINYVDKYPIAANALLAWYKVFSKTNFNNFNELKQVYNNASIINNKRIIFNIKGNSFRLIVSVDFKRRLAYVIWFGTHKEYDKIDAATIAYVEI
ncbi:MAG: type II toxin-antitoxin system HigB family toxin [Bacteroidota bacterium]|nr:type II toxin-antitoxin system HigB family toxin [Bacteroidota bacterium]